MTAHADRTKFYIRYFYSEQFERFSREDHERNFAPVISLLGPLFRDNGAGVLRYIFTTLLSSALAGITEAQTQDGLLCERTFRMLYQSVRGQLLSDGGER